MAQLPLSGPAIPGHATLRLSQHRVSLHFDESGECEMSTKAGLYRGVEHQPRAAPEPASAPFPTVLLAYKHLL